jgi:hypothetical protein
MASGGEPYWPCVVRRSHLIETAAEARTYYEARLARAHAITCHAKAVTIVFERGATHLYSEEAKHAGAALQPMVTRELPSGRCDSRVFSIRRAQLMDEVLRAISLFTVSVPGTGRQASQNRMLHGPRLASGEYMRVVLRPGPDKAWTCVSSYPISESLWREMCRAKRAKFPP